MTARSLVFYNVQRLFGSGGSPIQRALAGGAEDAATSSEEIAAKIATIAAVIDRIGALAGAPLVVGLCEIETAELAQGIADAVTTADLRCVDVRGDDQTGFALDGLNISLLYAADAVADISLLRSHVIDRTFITRDVLECDLTLAGGAPLSVLVNHWPSRLVGEAAGQRVSAAHYVRRLVAAKTRYELAEMWDADRGLLDLPTKDEMTARAQTPVVVMGDFNDEVFNESIELLGSTSDASAVEDDLRVRGRTKKERFRTYTRSAPLLYNPYWAWVGRTGSYYRSPRWRLYDQILVGRGLVGGRGALRYVDGSGRVFGERTVMRGDGIEHTITNRGGKPIAYDHDRGRGCSDHFPVFASVEVEG